MNKMAAKIAEDMNDKQDNYSAITLVRRRNKNG